MGSVPPIGRTGIPEVDALYESWEAEAAAKGEQARPPTLDIPQDVLQKQHAANQANEASSWWSGFYDALKPERDDISLPSHLTSELIRGSFGQAMSGLASTFVDLPGKILSGAQNLPGALQQAGYEGRNVADTLQAQSPELAKQIDETVNALYPVNTEMTKSFWAGDLPRGAGSLAFNLLAGPSGALTLGSAIAAGQGFKEAEEAGASFPGAVGSLVSNGLLGATEAAPILGAYERVANKLGPLAMEKILNKYANTTLAAGIAGVLEEGTQEVLQQFGSNVTAKMLYDTQRDLLEGVATSGEVGGILGFVMNAVARKIGHLRTSKYDKPNTRAMPPVITDMEKREVITPQDNLGLERRLQASQDEMKFLGAVPEYSTTLSGKDLETAQLIGPTLTLADGSTVAMNREWEPEIKTKFIEEIVKSGQQVTDVTGSALDVQEYYNLLATYATPSQTVDMVMSSAEEANYTATVLGDLGISVVADGNTLIMYPNAKAKQEGADLKYTPPAPQTEGLTNVLEQGGTFTEQEFIMPTDESQEPAAPTAPFHSGWSPEYEAHLRSTQDRPPLVLAYEALRRDVDSGTITDGMVVANAQARLMEMEELIKQRHPDWAEQFKLGAPRERIFTPEIQYGPEGPPGPWQLPLPMLSPEQPTQGAPMVASNLNLTPEQRIDAARQSYELGEQADQLLEKMIGKRQAINQLPPRVQLMLALESEGFDPRLLAEDEIDGLTEDKAAADLEEEMELSVPGFRAERRAYVARQLQDVPARTVQTPTGPVTMGRYSPELLPDVHGTLLIGDQGTVIASAKGRGITTMNHEIGHNLVKRVEGMKFRVHNADIILSEEGTLTGEPVNETLDKISSGLKNAYYNDAARAREEVFVRLMSSVKNIWEPQAQEELKNLIMLDTSLEHTLDLARALANLTTDATKGKNDYWSRRLVRFMNIVHTRLDPSISLVTWADTVLGTQAVYVNENGQWSIDYGDHAETFERFEDLLLLYDKKSDFTQAPDLMGNLEREAKELGGKDFFDGLPWVDGPPRYNPEADQLGPVTEDDIYEAVNKYNRREVMQGKPFKEEVQREEAKESFGAAGLTSFWRAARDWFNEVERDLGHQVFTNIYLPLDSARIPHDRWLDQAAKKIKHLWKIPVERRVMLRDYLEAKGPEAKEEVALRNHMTDQERRWAAEIRGYFDETFREFGIGDAAPYVEDYMPRVMRAVYAQRAGKKTDFSPFAEPGVNETADYFAKHARTIEDAKRAATEPDAVKLLWIHMQLGAREHFMGDAWDQAVKAFKDPDLPKGLRHPIANYMNTMYGGRDFSMDAIRNWWRALIKLPLMNRLGLTEDWIDKLVLFQYSSSLGMRPALMVRDMTQSFLSAYPHLGAKWYGHGLRHIADEATWDLAEKYGALVPQASAPIPEGAFTPGQREKGELFTEDFLRSTLWFTQAGNNIGRAVTFRAAYDRALPAIARFRQDHNVDVFHRDSGAGKLQEALTKDIEAKAVSDSISIEDVAGTLARYFVEHTQFPFRKGNAPWPLRYHGGRILGMYGQWSEQFGEYMWRSWRRGTPAERLQWLSRWAVSNFATYKFFETMGADVSRWVWTSPAEYSGSVFSSLAADIMGAPAIGSKYGETARAALIEAPLSFVPMATQLKNMAKAMNDPNPLIRMLGFTPVKPKPPFSDEYAVPGEKRFVVTPEGKMLNSSGGHGQVYERLGFGLADWQRFGSPPGYVDLIQKEGEVDIRLNSATPFQDLMHAAPHIDKRAPMYVLDIFENGTGTPAVGIPRFKSFGELMRFVKDFKFRNYETIDRELEDLRDRGIQGEPGVQVPEILQEFPPQPGGPETLPPDDEDIEFSVSRRGFLQKLAGVLGSTVFDKTLLGKVAKFVADPVQAMSKPVTNLLDLKVNGIYMFEGKPYILKFFDDPNVPPPYDNVDLYLLDPSIAHKDLDDIIKDEDDYTSKAISLTGSYLDALDALYARSPEPMESEGLDPYQVTRHENLAQLAGTIESLPISKGWRGAAGSRGFEGEAGTGGGEISLADLRFTGAMSKINPGDQYDGNLRQVVQDQLSRTAADYHRFFEDRTIAQDRYQEGQMESTAQPRQQFGRFTRRDYIASDRKLLKAPRGPEWNAAIQKYLSRPPKQGQTEQTEVLPGVFRTGDLGWANKPETKTYDLIVWDRANGAYVDTFFSVAPDEDLVEKVEERRQVFGWNERPK